MPCTLNREYLFIHIPKTGGTSVEVAMGMHGPWQIENQNLLYGLIKDQCLLSKGWLSAFLQHLTLQDLYQAWGSELAGAVSFSVVRNPWARFASIFTNIDTHLKQTASSNGIELEGLDFSGFVRATADLSHAHLRPQRDYLINSSGLIAVENILRTNRLEQDFSEFCSKYNLSSRLPWVNKSSSSIPFEHHYSARTWSEIGDRYSMDVDLWESINNF